MICCTKKAFRTIAKVAAGKDRRDSVKIIFCLFRFLKYLSWQNSQWILIITRKHNSVNGDLSLEKKKKKTNHVKSSKRSGVLVSFSVANALSFSRLVSILPKVPELLSCSHLLLISKPIAFLILAACPLGGHHPLSQNSPPWPFLLDKHGSF